MPGETAADDEALRNTNEDEVDEGEPNEVDDGDGDDEPNEVDDGDDDDGWWDGPPTELERFGGYDFFTDPLGPGLTVHDQLYEQFIRDASELRKFISYFTLCLILTYII